MYLHIGDDVVVALADLVAIIAADSMERSTDNRNFMQKVGVELNGDAEINAWVITKNKVYGSPVSSLTLKKRAGFLPAMGEENS
ncbi:MAG TPA: DUF370 domain-containing protein [Firmicutes bacterium]|jgi:hypothetical protein|nr:DUF370 domain-containing protein [Bacillota bacterium]